MNVDGYSGDGTKRDKKLQDFIKFLKCETKELLILMNLLLETYCPVGMTLIKKN